MLSLFFINTSALSIQEIKAVLGIIAGIITFLAYIFYIIAILKGKTRPSRTSWWIWSFVGTVLGASYYFSGAENTIWVPVAEIIGPITIAILSIWHGEGELDNKTDLICFIGSCVSLALWFIFNSPVIALITNLSVDLFAAIPTIIKSYLRPKGEDLLAWLLTVTGNALNLLAVEKYIFSIWIYPTYMFAINSFILILLFSQRRIDIIKIYDKK